ncbi:ankyrin repeat and MYND domain-containing protein 1-like isoform 2-T2 [Spinachia spinachia]
MAKMGVSGSETGNRGGRSLRLCEKVCIKFPFPLIVWQTGPAPHALILLGPGSQSNGVTHTVRTDVGLWLQERLLRFCSSVEDGFSLKNFPEYAAYVDLAAITRSLTQPPTGVLQPEASTESELETDMNMPSEDFILPPGIEKYSTDGEHLPLPPGRRKELDQHFYGELWEPDAYARGFERDPIAILPLQPRMLANVHKHRLHAGNVGWDVAAVLAMDRDGFGPKGPLEVSSELFIQYASKGDRKAVSRILWNNSVHRDVADSQGHTALIAATVTLYTVCSPIVSQLVLSFVF